MTEKFQQRQEAIDNLLPPLSKNDDGRKGGTVGSGTSFPTCGALNGQHQRWCKEK